MTGETYINGKLEALEERARKSEKGLDEILANLNELRVDFAAVKGVDTQLDNIVGVINKLRVDFTREITKLNGKLNGRARTWGIIGGALSAIPALITTLILLLRTIA